MTTPKLSYGLLGIAIVFSAVATPALPDEVAPVWAEQGAVPRWWAAIAAPLAMLLVLLFARIIPKIDPRRDNYARFESTYWLLFNAVLALLLSFHALTIARALSIGSMEHARWAGIAAGVFLMITGNYLARVEPNWFLGFRNPWTLASDKVWRRTHRLAAWLLVVGGIGLGALASQRTIDPLSSAAIILAVTTCASLIYSFVLWRSDGQDSNPAATTTGEIH